MSGAAAVTRVVLDVDAVVTVGHEVSSAAHHDVANGALDERLHTDPAHLLDRAAQRLPLDRSVVDDLPIQNHVRAVERHVARERQVEQVLHVEDAAAGAHHGDVSGVHEGAHRLLDARGGHHVQAFVVVAARERAVHVKERDDGTLVLLGHCSSFIGHLVSEHTASCPHPRTPKHGLGSRFCRRTDYRIYIRSSETCHAGKASQLAAKVNPNPITVWVHAISWKTYIRS